MRSLEEAPSRPVMRYHGAKYRIRRWVIDHFPEHRLYLEPYGGAASVLLAKEPSFSEIYNDIDDAVVDIFRVLRDPASAAELRRLCELTPFSRTEFERAYEPSDDIIERSRRMLVRSWMGHGSSGVRVHRTGFRVNPHRQRTTATMDWEGWPEAIATFTARLKKVTIENRPAVDLIIKYDVPGTLMYLDPPYVFETRSQKRIGNDLYHGYRHEMTDDDHRALLEVLRGLRHAMVVLSGYDSAIYTEALGDWLRVETEARADRAVLRTEVLYLNPRAKWGLEHRGPLFAEIA